MLNDMYGHTALSNGRSTKGLPIRELEIIAESYQSVARERIGV